jgi:DNA-binding transcriptional LysR family regulator
VALLDLLRHANLEPKRVHAVSSDSAMTPRVERGFGVATLPRRAATRLLEHRELRLSATDPPLPPVPVFASYRLDAASSSVQAIVRSALAFIAETELETFKTWGRRKTPGYPSKQSMRQSE